MHLEQSLAELENNMNWRKALIYVTGFSYLGGVTTSLGGYPLITNIHPISQVIGFLLAFILLFSSFKYPKIKWLLSAIYGIAAILSFSGLVTWTSYYGASGFLGPMMAAWDILLAIAILMN